MKHINKQILQFFGALADETRLRILVSLTDKPRNVNEIYSIVGKGTMTLSAISHQLSQLYDQNIVTYCKNGREKTFSLSDGFCWCILTDAFKHFNNKTKCKACLHIKKQNK